jgi:hypothetical protein
MQKDFINKVSPSNVCDLWNSGCNVVPLVATCGNCTHAHWSWSLTVPLKVSDSSDVLPRLVAAQQISQVIKISNKGIKNIYLHSVWENMTICKAYLYWQPHNLIYEVENYASVATKLFCRIYGSIEHVSNQQETIIRLKKYKINYFESCIIFRVCYIM